MKPFSQIGVPVFLSDVKGDLTGISQPGNIGGKMADILKERGIDLPTPMACPATLWDVFGEQGHPVAGHGALNADAVDFMPTSVHPCAVNGLGIAQGCTLAGGRASG